MTPAQREACDHDRHVDVMAQLIKIANKENRTDVLLGLIAVIVLADLVIALLSKLA